MARWRFVGSFVVLAALVCAGTASAQAPSNSPEKSPGVTIVLPQKVVAGQRATLAVLDALGRLAPETVVAFSGGEHVRTDATGRFTFTAPAEPGVLLAHLPATGANASTTVIAPPQIPPDGVQVLDYPRVISLLDRFVVEGYGFRGEADSTRVLLGDKPALVLAASPVALVVLPAPGSKEGPTQLLLEVGGRSPGPVPVTLVSFEMLAPEKPLAPKEKGTLKVRVRGTDQRLELEARNLTPDVVELPGGNPQRVISTGSSNNEAEIELLGVRPGDFSVSVRLVPSASGLPDVESVREHLLAARKLATGHWPERVDRVLREIDRDPQEVSKIRDELEKMLAEQPPGEFGRLLEAAWRELLKH